MKTPIAMRNTDRPTEPDRHMHGRVNTPVKRPAAGFAALACLSAFCCLGPGFGKTMGQTLYMAASAGASNYQGELKDGVVTTRGSRLALGAGLQYSPNERVAFGTELHSAMLGGSDRYNTFYFARRRNLHFDTRVWEWSLSARVNLLVDRESAAIPYLTAGLALFKVDPFTTDPSGERVYLQPLSTEGQGLTGSGVPPHRNPNLSIPFGGGLELRLTRRLRLDIELASRKTFTDHIDDVGNTYPDGGLLLAERGARALELSYRGDELPGGEPFFPEAGTPRGNPKTKDWYIFLLFRLRYPLFDRSYRYDRINHIFRSPSWPYGG